MSDDLTYGELLRPGEVGDRVLEVQLTLRQLSALSVLMNQASRLGLSDAIIAEFASQDTVAGEGWRIAWAELNATLGMAAAQAFGVEPDYGLAFASLTALLDQQKAEWRDSA